MCTQKMNVNSLPEEMRPKNRTLKYGPEALTDRELLSVIIRDGKIHDIPYEELSVLTYTELIASGLTRKAALTVICLDEFAKRYSRQDFREKVSLKSPEDVASLMKMQLKYKEHEELWILYLDQKHRLIDSSMATKGTKDSSLASVSEILREALRRNASSILMVHNHPGSDPLPSEEDTNITQRVSEGCNATGIRLDDHIIIGGNSYYSFKEKGFI